LQKPKHCSTAGWIIISIERGKDYKVFKDFKVFRGFKVIKENETEYKLNLTLL
jgi:hypothetical protein